MALTIEEIRKNVGDSYTRFYDLRNRVVEDIKFAYINGGQHPDTQLDIDGFLSLNSNNSFGPRGRLGPQYTINRVLHPLRS
jgi:hypothetical protein